MTMTQIEDVAGNTAEVSTARDGIELAVTFEDGQCFTADDDGSTVGSLVLTPRKARALARWLLEQADEFEGDED